jgi:arylformamidase
VSTVMGRAGTSVTLPSASVGEPFDWQREYSPSSMIGGDLAPIIADWQHRSREVAAAHVVEERAGGSLLIRAAQPDAPVLVFVHGGYWRALSAADSLFLAVPYLRAGWSFLAVEYTLAPAARIEQMVDETAAALVDVAAIRPSRLVTLGHSAGAHLLAMATLVRPAPVRVDRTVLVSGIYDCRHVLHIDVNEVVHLDEASSVALSPLLHPSPAGHDLHVVCGQIETDSFRTMSRQYADHCGVRYVEVAGRHHFDVIEDELVVSASCRR